MSDDVKRLTEILVERDCPGDQYCARHHESMDWLIELAERQRGEIERLKELKTCVDEWVKRVEPKIDDATSYFENLIAQLAVKDDEILRVNTEWVEMREKLAVARDALRREHCCATYDAATRSCDGCFVSEALAAIDAIAAEKEKL